MRIAIVSDVHANCIAFDAVLTELGNERIDRTVCLGDALQGGPQPVETAARLRELACPVVMGNADSFLLTGNSKTPHTASQIAVRDWTLGKLSQSDLDFISTFQATVEIALGKSRLLAFHGSPASFDDIIFPETDEAQVQAWLAPYKQSILTGGHTHLQQIRRNGDLFFFNPGSIGLANGPLHTRDNSKLDDWAEYAILSVEGKRIALEFRRVPFDVQALIRAYRSSGRPFADEMIAQYGG